MAKRVKIEGSPNLVRDLDSKAVINRSTEAYDSYMCGHHKRVEGEKRLLTLEDRLTGLEDTLKQILKKLEG